MDKRIKKLMFPVRFPNPSTNVDPTNATAVALHDYYFKLRKSYTQRKKFYLGLWNWISRELFKRSKKLVERNHDKVQKLTGMSKGRQRRDLLATCLTMPCKPIDYYIYEFYLKENKEHGRNYIFKYQTKNMLYRMLLDKKQGKNLGEISPLTNKEDFQKRVFEAGLPHIPTICIVESGEVRYFGKWDIQDISYPIFAKALDGRGGRDAEIWRYRPEEKGFKRARDQRIFKFSEIIDGYKKTSHTNPMIIQRRLVNHRDLKDLSCNALSTYRVVTMVNEAGDIEVIAAALRMAARKKKPVDNFHKGGIASSIDIHTGILGEATDLGVYLKVGYLSHHPITGARINGRQVPMWQEAKELVKEAHKVFAPRVIIGWDVAVTQEGPVLVEGNAQPCVDLIQRVTQKPLTQTRFGELMNHHIERNN